MPKTDSRSGAPKAVSLIASALALGVGASALAGDVRGKMDVRGKLEDPGNGDPAAPLAPYWEEWNGFLEPEEADPTPDRVLAVVLLGEGPPEPSGCEYTLQGGDLTPTTLVAKQGTTLRIENTDPMAHELHANDLDGFSPLQTAPGNARTVPLEQAGHFVVRDRL
ncbi:MAG: cupredoxin domain-containing protein, partial [Myxococcota bacterium]